MLNITRTNTFSAAHLLPLTPENHKCRGMHGHSYEVTVEVTGDVDDAGWIIDTGLIDKAYGYIHAMLDHKTLNEVAGLENPTTENLVVWLWEKFHKTFGDMRNIHKIGITVKEGSRSTAFYDGVV